MSIYFEASVNTSTDHFIELVPVFFLIFLVLKYPLFSQIFADITKVNRIVLARIFLGMMVLYSIGSIFNYVNIIKLEKTINKKEYSQVSGCITGYKLERPKVGTVVESFKVNGVPFEFNNYDRGMYFNSTLHADKFLRNNRCVSINYVQTGAQNKIIKISS